MPSFTLLSQDLEALIFEFLPLSDYPSLQLAAKRFNQTLQQHPELWAKHLFSTFLKPSRDLDDILEEDIYDGIPLITEDHFLFDEMKASKAIIQTHHTARSQLETCLRLALNKGPAQSLTRALMTTLRTPAYPVPYLKRDIHFFETTTLFQNFLTEVFFAIQARSIPNDKKQTLIRSIVENLKESCDYDSITERDLLLLQQHPRGGLEALREARTAGSEEEGDLVTRKTGGEYGESANVLENGRSGLFNFVETFYSIIHELVRNRCDMVVACLEAIKTPQELLSEYYRLWFGFALTIMEMNRSLVPFSQFINELYKKKCNEAQNVPEFSVWKLMVGLWRNTVFEHLSGRLFEALISMFCVAREEDRISKDTEVSEQVNKTVNPFADPTTDSVELRSEKLKILRAFYNAVGDLSYNESTIFYWRCFVIGNETPKGQLDNKIIEMLLTCCRSNRLLWIEKPLELVELLKDDHKMVEAVFGRELTLRVKESQLEFIRCFLADHLVSICDSLANSSSHSVVTAEKDECEEFTQASEMNSFEYLFKVLEVHELFQGRISSNKELRETLPIVLRKEQKRLFNPLLTYSDKLKEGLAVYFEENQEIYLDLVQRGFGQLDEEEKALFILIGDRTTEHQATKYW